MAEEYTFRQDETGPLPPGEQPQTIDTDRPSWLPEQFKTPEEMAKSWRETQANYTRTRQELSELRGYPEDSQEEVPTEQEAGSSSPEEIKGDNLDNAAERITEQAGVDVSEYTAEYQSTGDVSEESRVALAESLKGVLGNDARSMIDDYIEAKKVVHTNNSKAYMDEAGGAEQYQEMVAWAADTLPPEQIQAYNSAVESGDRHTTMFAIRGLRAQFESANGRTPGRMHSGTTRVGGVAPFQSAAEMRAAMKDPRYKQDPAYRESVRRRLDASENF